MMLVDPIRFRDIKTRAPAQSYEEVRALALQAERAWVLREISAPRRRWFTQAVLPPDPLVAPPARRGRHPETLVLYMGTFQGVFVEDVRHEIDPWDAPSHYPRASFWGAPLRPRPLDHWSAQLRWYAENGRVPEVE